MDRSFTSVPRTAGGGPPPVRAREIIAVSFTAAGADTAKEWLDASREGTLRRHIQATEADSSVLRRIGDMVKHSRVGTHLLFAGPQPDIYAARAQAIKNGAIDAEIALRETGDRSLRVSCAHCKETTVTPRAVGDTVHCAGCSRELVVYHHFSRLTASYLGYMVNAEEIA